MCCLPLAGIDKVVVMDANVSACVFNVGYIVDVEPLNIFTSLMVP